MTPSEPRNPLYLLLLLASALFVITALAYALVPELEKKAAEAGQPAPPSPFRDSLRKNGWKWLLYEVAAMIVLGLASMLVDRQRLRSLQIDREAGTIPSQESTKESPSSQAVQHDNPNKTDRGTAQTD